MSRRKEEKKQFLLETKSTVSLFKILFAIDETKHDPQLPNNVWVSSGHSSDFHNREDIVILLH